MNGNLILMKVREYEEVSEKGIRKEERPEFHLSVRIGWMNDPNGFSFYNGKYHLFYQYNPYETKWGPMHWGHAVSSDLLHWEYLPAALAPDQPYDQDGCFSGSAIVMPDGSHLLVYTGVVKEILEDGTSRDVQTQCLAVGDGINYRKFSGNPVLGASDLPEGCSKYDFRDPKAWIGTDGLYRCVVGNRPADGSGQILLFTSTDGFDWKYSKVLVANHHRFGTMWECPDFFVLDGKGVLIVSPMDMVRTDDEYPDGHGTLCIIGEYNEGIDDFVEQRDQAVDYGIDFYAMQTISVPDGRRIMIGWMQGWDTVSYCPSEVKWFGQMSIPRELLIRDNRLYQKPIRELETLRRDKVEYQNVSVCGTTVLPGIEGREADIELTIRPEAPDDLYQTFTMKFAQNEQHYTSLCFEPAKSALTLDRTFSGCGREETDQRKCLVKGDPKELKVRMILDRFSAEIFLNDGVQVLTAVIYTEQDADQISFSADGRVRMDVVKYSLRERV